MPVHDILQGSRTGPPMAGAAHSMPTAAAVAGAGAGNTRQSEPSTLAGRPRGAPSGTKRFRLGGWLQTPEIVLKGPEAISMDRLHDEIASIPDRIDSDPRLLEKMIFPDGTHAVNATALLAAMRQSTPQSIDDAFHWHLTRPQDESIPTWADRMGLHWGASVDPSRGDALFKNIRTYLNANNLCNADENARHCNAAVRLKPELTHEANIGRLAFYIGAGSYLNAATPPPVILQLPELKCATPFGIVDANGIVHTGLIKDPNAVPRAIYLNERLYGEKFTSKVVVHEHVHVYESPWHSLALLEMANQLVGPMHLGEAAGHAVKELIFKWQEAIADYFGNHAISGGIADSGYARIGYDELVSDALARLANTRLLTQQAHDEGLERIAGSLFQKQLKSTFDIVSAIESVQPDWSLMQYTLMTCAVISLAALVAVLALDGSESDSADPFADGGRRHDSLLDAWPPVVSSDVWKPLPDAVPDVAIAEDQFSAGQLRSWRGKIGRLQPAASRLLYLKEAAMQVPDTELPSSTAQKIMEVDPDQFEASMSDLMSKGLVDQAGRLLPRTQAAMTTMSSDLARRDRALEIRTASVAHA